MIFEFNKIAILTDNPFLCKAFESILSSYNTQLNKVDFFVSPFSNTKAFDVSPIRVLDVKNSDDVDYLIANYDLIFSIHSKQLFPKLLVDKVKCINVHPGFNPYNRGWYPQVFAILNNTPIGATIHEIDELLDHGAIIAQSRVEIEANDTSLSLYNKVVEQEVSLLENHIESILRNSYSTFLPLSEGVVNLKKDFRQLCEIDLDKKASYREVINHLRALSHGDFKNLFFKDKTGKKVYIKIELELETQ